MNRETQRVSDRVREANARGHRLRITGRSQWLSANRPVRAVDYVSAAECAGIREYTPGDLTLTAGAGTSLAEIGDATRVHGQWLALDPFGGDGGTLGATVATASVGPHASCFGGPRDVVLGTECVIGTGDVIRTGGRVVKNVAGFDLTRLQTGAWGTLGVITEVTVRLRGLPPVAETVAAELQDDVESLDKLVAALAALPAVPYACEVVNAPFAEYLGLAPRPALIARVAGNAQSVTAQLRDLKAILGFEAFGDHLWSGFRTVDKPDTAVWRCSAARGAFGATWHAATRALQPWRTAFAHGSPLRGVVRCLVFEGTHDSNAETVSAAVAAPFTGTRIGEILPDAAWQHFRPATADRLSQGIKRAFDPNGLLNAGVFGELS